MTNSFIVTASGWFSRFVVAFVQFVVIKIITAHLGQDDYALFAILTGTIGWYVLTEFGIGTSLQNMISERRSRAVDYHILVSITAVIVILMLVIQVVILFFVGSKIGVFLLGQFDYVSDVEKAKYFLIISILLTTTALSSVAYKVWFAEHKGYIPNLVQAVAALLGLVGVWIVAINDLDDKLFYVLLAYAIPGALLALISLVLNIKVVSKTDAIAFIKNDWYYLIKFGLKFWALAFMAMIVVQTDFIIMSQFVAADSIVVYAIVSKVFTLGYFLYISLMQALWPSFSEMINNNDWQGVNIKYKYYLKISLVVSFFGFIFVALTIDGIFKFLSNNDQINVPLTLVLCFSLLTIVRVWTDVYATILQSMNDVTFFSYFVLIQAIVSVSMQILLVEDFGIHGIVLGVASSYLLTVAWALPLRYKYQYQQGIRNKA